MQVDILLNRQPSADPVRAEAGCLAIFERRMDAQYQPGDLLENVYQTECPVSFAQSQSGLAGDDDSALLEWAFMTFNIQHPADYRQRSLSCGDVVVLDHKRAYACLSIGWTPVELG